MKQEIKSILMAILCLTLCVMPALAEAESEETPIAGPVLVGTLPKDAELVESITNEDGSYSELLSVDDQAIGIAIYRNPIDELHPIDMSIEAYVALYTDEVGDFERVEAKPIAAYPAQRARFTIGAEEDSTQMDAVLVITDQYMFGFFVGTSADAYYGYRDAYAEGEIPSLIDTWVESLDLFDAGETAEVQGK